MPAESEAGFRACTIVARNYLAHARVLARSFASHHPGAALTVLVIDDPSRSTVASAEPFSVLHLEEIVPPDELSHLLMIYDVKELATAVKPLLLRWALTQGDRVVMYLDPDIEVFDSLAEIADLAAEHSIVLNPHTTSPLTKDGSLPSEANILASGIYNLGFLAVSADAGPFLDWWWERLRRDCLVDPGQMLFVDQRWVDFVPGLFRHTILRDPGVNVAYWNLHNRHVARSGDRYEVDGNPLRFFHFSGFSPDSPWILTTHFGQNRVLLSQHPVLQRLCLEYAEKLRGQGYVDMAAVPYAWGMLPSGLEVTQTLRELYREVLLRAEAGLGPPPPDPRDASGSDKFLAWLNEPVAGRAPWLLSRFLFHIYEQRPDVREACPGLSRTGVGHFLHWIREYGVDEHRIDARLLPPSIEGEATHPETTEPERHFGANVAGYLRAELGVGEAGRLVVAALSAAGVPLATRTLAGTLSRQDHTFVEIQPDEEPYGINIICVNADQTESFAAHTGKDYFEGRYSVGLWFWEVEEFPRLYRTALEVVDEVWAASPFVAKALKAATSKPVTTVQLPVLAPPPVETDRRRFGLSDGYLFLYVYDFMSVFERKNPLGVLEAFSRAFAPGEGPILVLKSVNGERCRGDLERLRFAATGRPDVMIWDEYVSAEDLWALMAACDCYVSLHRSEGFGLTMAEAMALGKPVIATAYSGNMSFMRDEDSYLVDYSLVPVPPGCEPYPVTARWAEPDLDQAANLIRLVVADPKTAAARGRAGRDRILAERSPEAAGKQLRERLLEIEESYSRSDSATGTVGPPSPIAAGDPWRSTIVRCARPLMDRLRRARLPRAPAMMPTPEGAPDCKQERPPLQPQHPRPVEDPAHAVAGLLGRLSSRTETLEQRTTIAERGLAELRRGLLVVPYMSDPGELLTTDPWGRTTIGFERSNGGNEADIYRGFEDIFRGPEEFIRQRQRVYLELLGDRTPVLDVGCGRGELLDLLAEAGVEGMGVDLDAGMVEACVAKGHTVELADCNDYLAAQPEGRFGAIISAQFIEHIPYEVLVRFIELSYRKLAPGGLFVAETVNPHALHAFKTFWIDLSHQKPIFPEVAAAICKMTGFDSGFIFYPNGTEDPVVDVWKQGEYSIVCKKTSS